VIIMTQTNADQYFEDLAGTGSVPTDIGFAESTYSAGSVLHMDEASQRIQLGSEAGEVYVAKLESIRDDLDNIDNSGATLGVMVAAQLKMTEAETEYMVRAGLPKKVSSSVQAAANDVKKAAG
jgi:hypothetical protein